MAGEAGRTWPFVPHSENPGKSDTDLAVRVGVFALALCGRHFRLEFLGTSLRLVQGWPRPGEVLLLGQQMPDENRELARGAGACGGNAVHFPDRSKARRIGASLVWDTEIEMLAIANCLLKKEE